MYTENVAFVQDCGQTVVNKPVNYEIHGGEIVISGNATVADMILRSGDHDSVIFRSGKPIEAMLEDEVGLENYRDFLCIKRHFEQKDLKRFYWAFVHRAVIDYLLNQAKFMPIDQMKARFNECLEELCIGNVLMDSKTDKQFFLEVEGDDNFIDFLNCAHELIENFFVKRAPDTSKNIFYIPFDMVRQILDNLEDIKYLYMADSR